MSETSKTRIQTRTTGDWLVIDVESASGNGWHRVDLDAFPLRRPGGEVYRNGACNCDNFHFRCGKLAASGVQARCKHIVEALAYLAEVVIEGAIVDRAKRSGEPYANEHV